MLITLIALLLGAGATACARGDDDTRHAPAAPPFSVETGDRGALRVIGADTLSDSMRIVGVYPESDGEAVAFTFADPARPVVAGLGLLERGADTARLVWPDSVTAVSWTGPHRLAFQTRTGPEGVHAVVDVHAERLEHVEHAHDTVAAAAPAPARELPAAQARATAYIDSVRVQPQGTPQRGALAYTVTRVLPAPGDTLAAFYVVARNGDRGDRLNPAWYLVDVRSGAVAPVDSVTGPPTELSESAAAWGGSRRFLYAVGGKLREAVVK